MDISHVCREWVCQAIEKIYADFNRSSDTHLIQLDLPFFSGIDLYLKDESTHPSGSLKHRLARSLFLYGLCNGKIHEDTTIIEASSGSTAISEAYFARLLNLKFIAVVPETTAREKLALIEFYGGQCVKVPGHDIYAESERLEKALNGYYMNQFLYAERATDWRSNNNIAESIFKQMAKETHPIPEWVIVGAGTGGTSATIGRYIRYKPHLYKRTKLLVADVENSVFYPFYQTRDATLTAAVGSRIEGIGRPRVEPSFNPDVVDQMVVIPDAASIATAHWLQGILGRKVGASTGTNVYAALQTMQTMQKNRQTGSLVTLLCDSGERYLNTYFNDAWLSEKQIDIQPYLAELNQLTN
ncbi:PLP-dependent cysteine synthase family protein [Ostreibacterium oceani]|uniref:L-cysteine desulfhydrase Cds1 n=1 Tax=Ostreibacterium oceani TaxID=2654998 RepID=A0A6N7ES84_9GAMM|nr:PLP-dependent cysteine synthase family protein [Ostreibacterium oceani]MPV85401.1 pyridoxal-phosphate dependent enzyme [Ostreibacterium oceani]